MQLITDNDSLVKFVPNVFSTIDSETSLFDKLTPWLDKSENWLIDNLVGDIIPVIPDTTPLFADLRSFVVCDALRQAVPSLDVVLTPNGFGIVNTNTIVPASKERIERLLAALTSQKDNLLHSILCKLRKLPAWHTTPQCSWLAQSLIQDYVFALADKTENDKWLSFVNIRQKFVPWQNRIAEEWISPELLARLLTEYATDSLSDDGQFVVLSLKAVAADIIKHGRLDDRKMLSVVDYIRHRPEEFAEWRTSQTAELFEGIYFKNEKKKSGYFF